MGYSYIGARGNINVWSPRVELPNDYTTGQIWLKNGPGNSFESIEVGWMVSSLNKTLNPFFSSYLKPIILVTNFFVKFVNIVFSFSRSTKSYCVIHNPDFLYDGL